MPYLRYIDDTGQIQTKTLDTEQFIIGRAATCQLTIDSDMISREHVRIDLEGDGRYRIRDLGSRNKTHVNGEVITETLLTPGAIVRIGDWITEFVDDTADPEAIDLSFLTPDRSDPPHCQWIKMKAPLSLTASQIEQLSQLQGTQALTARPEDIADAALGNVLHHLQAERGLIAMRGDTKMDLKPLAHRALKRGDAASITPVSQSFIFAPVLQNVSGRYPETAGQLDTKLGYSMTALVAPLTHRGEILGVLYVDRPSTKKPFSATALQYCAAAGAHVGALVAQSAQNLVRFATREGATWLSTIRRLQTGLTANTPKHDSFDIATRCFPGRLRCGAFSAVIPIDQQRCGIVVIDGGGQGITGVAQSRAILTAIETALFLSEDALLDPGPMFNTISKLVASTKARQILPCVFVGIDMSSGKLAYVNAGGMPPLLMVSPGRRRSTSAARIASSWSPHRMRPRSSTTPMRSPSPSKAMPRSHFPAATASMSWARFSGTVGSG